MAETLKSIQELIEQNMILEKRNEELKKIIDINLSLPDLDPEIPIKELFAKTEIENLLLQFFQNYKIPIAIFSNSGDILFSFGWKKIFTTLINPAKNISCIDSILEQIKLKPHEKLYRHKCPNGLYTISYPLEIKGNKKALLVLNQFFIKNELPDASVISDFAEKYHIEEKELFKIMGGITVIAPEDVDNIIKQGAILAEMVMFIGNKNFEFYKRFKQQLDNSALLISLKQKIEEQENVIKNLRHTIDEHQKDIHDNTLTKSEVQKETGKLTQKLNRTETILDSILNSTPFGFYIITEGIITYTNNQTYKFTGYSPKEIIGRPVQFLFPQLIWDDIVSKEKQVQFGDYHAFQTQIKRKPGIFCTIDSYISPLQKNKHNRSYILSTILKDSAKNKFSNALINVVVENM